MTSVHFKCFSEKSSHSALGGVYKLILSNIPLIYGYTSPVNAVIDKLSRKLHVSSTKRTIACISTEASFLGLFPLQDQ